MILVLNLNASVDKRYELNDIKKDTVMRARRVENTPGGKGIHVANVSTILKEDCIVTGFVGGKSGEFIEEKLKDYGINQDFVKIKGETRECLAFITDDLVQTEILEPGPIVSEYEQQEFLQKYIELINNCDVIVASGSLPKNVPSTFYRNLIELANAQNKKFLLDTSGEALKEGIEGKPYFIKPNKDEIEALTGRKISSVEDAVREIKEFHKKGIKFVIISLGKDGSIAGINNELYRVTFPQVEAVNPVGSGDSYVAGIAIGIQRKYDVKDILKLASACGTANALEKETGVVSESVVKELFDKVEVKKIMEK
jgi:tagatose 6-phosphate kinase